MKRAALLITFVILSNIAIAQWVQTNGPYGGTLTCLAINSNGNIFAGTPIGLFLSTDSGNNWVQLENLLTSNYASTIAINSSDVIFVGTGVTNELFRSTNNGNSWTLINDGLGGTVSTIAINSSGVIFVGTSSGGVYRSTNNGDNWTSASNGLTYSQVVCFAINSNGDLFAGTYNYVYGWSAMNRSTDNGDNWTQIGFPSNASFIAINKSNGYIFAGGYIWPGSKIYRSTDNGDNWAETGGGYGNPINTIIVNSLGHIFASTGTGVYRSTNNGNTWLQTGMTSSNVVRFAINSSEHIYAGTYGNGIFLSTDNGSNWTKLGLRNSYVNSLVSNNYEDIFAGTWGDGAFRSTDAGNNWTQINTGGLENKYINAFTVKSNGYIFAGTFEAGVFLSINNGSNWTSVNNGLTDLYIYSLANSGDNIFAGTNSSGIFLSTDNGSNWTTVNNGLIVSGAIMSLIKSGDNIFAGTNGNGVFLSTDNGSSWTAVNYGLTNSNVYSLALSGDKIFAGTWGGGIFLSTNNGISWTEVNNGLSNPNIISISISGDNIFAGTWGGGIFLSTNNGSDWVQASEGLTNYITRSLIINSVSGYIFLGTDGSGVWQRPLSEMIELPTKISFYNLYRRNIDNPRFLAGTLPDGTPESPLKVCADSRDSITYFIVTPPDNIDPDFITARIQDDSLNLNEKEFGTIYKFNSYSDSVSFIYKHPRIVNSQGLSRNTQIQIINTQTNLVIYEYPVEIFRAPVLLVHGIWSKGDVFSTMQNSMYSTGMWSDLLVDSLDYSLMNMVSFYDNRYQVFSGIYYQIIKLIANKYSVGAVNVVGHSMGGVLARLYLQSDLYAHDICRLITLNTPHSGSQGANLLIDSRLPFPTIRFLMDLGGNNTRGGAVDDLAVDGYGTNILLNGEQLNKHYAPSHTITTYASEFNATGWDGFLSFLLQKFVPGVLIDVVYQDLFNNDSHDLVVALESQRGGVSSTSNPIANQKHSSSYSNPDVIDEVKTLLNEDPVNLSNNGFDPPTLNYSFLGGDKLSISANSTDSIYFSSPSPGQTFNTGETITVSIIGTPNITSFVFSSSLSNELLSFENFNSNSSTFSYSIPTQVAGKLYFSAFAFNDEGYLAMDTIFINVVPTASLDSIKLYPDDIVVLQNSMAPTNAIGFYADGIQRNISQLSNLNFSTLNNNIASFGEPGILSGISPGFTYGVISIDNLTDSISINVLTEQQITSIGDEQSYTFSNVTDFFLNQNYPNPFNPVTTIRYEIPKATNVVLKIYDILGREVTTLVNNEVKSPGMYEVQFNAANLASGVYFYRFTAGSYSISKKMILIK